MNVVEILSILFVSLLLFVVLKFVNNIGRIVIFSVTFILFINEFYPEYVAAITLFVTIGLPVMGVLFYIIGGYIYDKLNK